MNLGFASVHDIHVKQMAKGNNKNKNKKKQRKNSKSGNHNTILSSLTPSSASNFVSEAGPGCYIARRDLVPSLPEWMLEWEDVDIDEFIGQEVPELAMDPDEKTLSVCNTQDESIVAYITVYETKLRGRKGQLIPFGSTTNNEGNTRECVTFIVLCPPRVFAHLCYMDVPDETDIFHDVDIESDVQTWSRHPNPSETHNLPILFPLAGGPFLCTQGVGGQLTHFFSGNLHAIDFRCPVGTPLLAAGDGVVVEAKDENTLTGIAVSNLFEWNAILLKLDVNENEEPLFVEYVHIQKSSVKQGDRVAKRQVIGESGSVGFSPEPHLHFAAYKSNADTAPTIQVRFQTALSDGETFLPKAGLYYSASGESQEDGKVTIP